MIERDDERLAQLLRAVRAEADPVLWTRARARLAAEEPSGLIAWLMRPAALAASVATLVISVGVSVLLLFHAAPRDISTVSNLADALIATPSTPIEELTVPTTDALQPADTGTAQ
jgi:hypothetical protein